MALVAAEALKRGEVVLLYDFDDREGKACTSPEKSALYP
jgi:3,4-dihydroxy-2-butanone 4-phosphate synthase